jgi:hypothetical protein
VAGWKWFGDAAGQAWRGELAGKVVGAVCRAAASMQGAALRAGRADVRVGFNRRLPTDRGMVMKPNAQGTVVPWVDVLRVDDAGGQPLAALFTHAAHPVIVHRASTLVSGDFPAYSVATVRQRLGGGVVAMFAQGCGGNINGEPLASGFEAAEQAGVRLGEAAALAARGSEPVTASELKIASVTLTLPFRELPKPEECEETLRAAEERLAEAERSGASESQVWYARNEVLCRQCLLEKARRGEQPSGLRFEIHALTLADEWCLLAMTHEVFAEYQLWADQASPFRHNMVLAYTNGVEGYIPTDSDFVLGGYEAASFPSLGAALTYHHRLALRPGIERQLKEAISRVWG